MFPVAVAIQQGASFLKLRNLAINLGKYFCDPHMASPRYLGADSKQSAPRI
jgi:hypothetical protein